MATITSLRGMQLELTAMDYEVQCTGNGKTFSVVKTDSGFESRFLVSGTRVAVELDKENAGKADALFAQVAKNVESLLDEEKAYSDHHDAVIELMNQ